MVEHLKRFGCVVGSKLTGHARRFATEPTFDMFPAMDDLQATATSSCPAGFGDRREVTVGIGAQESPPAIAIWFDVDYERIVTGIVGECEVPGDVPMAGMDGELEAARAILESRIVGRLIEHEGVESNAQWRDRLVDLPFPSLEPRFRTQLEALYRRRPVADDPASLDWAIERVVAELYELPLSILVKMQDDIVSHC